MNKKYFYIIFIFIMLFSFNDVHALKSTSSELTERNVCEKFELALANSDGSIKSISCYSSYSDAKSAMDGHESDDAIILEKVSGKTKVIDAKYAIAYLNRGEVVTYVYTSSSLKTQSTYMNNDDAYGGTDAAFISLNYSNKAIKIKISGVTGWISNGTYTLVLLSWVKSSVSYLVLTITGGSGSYSYSWKNTLGTVLGSEEKLVLSSVPIANSFEISATIKDTTSGSSIDCNTTCTWSSWWGNAAVKDKTCYSYSKAAAEANNATWARDCTYVNDMDGCLPLSAPCYYVVEYSRGLTCS